MTSISTSVTDEKQLLCTDQVNELAEAKFHPDGDGVVVIANRSNETVVGRQQVVVETFRVRIPIARFRHQE